MKYTLRVIFHVLSYHSIIHTLDYIFYFTTKNMHNLVMCIMKYIFILISLMQVGTDGVEY